MKRVKEKKQKTPTYNFTLAQIEEMKRQSVADAVRELIELTIGLPAMALRDEKGWGKKRLEWFADAVMARYDSYDKGYFTLQDVRDMLKDECNFQIQLKETNRK